MIACWRFAFGALKAPQFICMVMLVVGCHSTLEIPEAEPIPAAALMSGTPQPAMPDPTAVYIAPIGLRAESKAGSRPSWLVVDLRFDGPQESVRDLAHALKYRFYYEAPRFVRLRNSQGRVSRLDSDLYDDRESTWVQFERGFLYERIVDNRLQALQSYSIVLKNRPRAETYSLQINAEALCDVLGSISSKYANVKIDENAHSFTLVRAEISVN